MWIRTALLVVLIQSSSFSATSENLGVYGETFDIYEEDLLKQIQRTLLTKKASGEMDDWLDAGKSRIKEKIIRPLPVPGIVRASVDKAWTFDPSITMEEDIWDTEGNLIVAAGTVINPLETVSLDQPLLFLDSDDPEQLAWAERQHAQSPRGTKIILVSGAPIELEVKLKQPIYFDQNGDLTRRFGIGAVPAIVSQSGFELVVQEVSL